MYRLAGPRLRHTHTGAVDAEAYLYVDLDNVARVVNRVVATLDRNPQILTQVLKAVDTTVTTALSRQGAARQ